jgi:hypothetical protein
MPKGDEEEIAVRSEVFFRFVALLATRALLERPTLNPSLIRDQSKAIAIVLFDQAHPDLAATPTAACIRDFRRGRTSSI